MKVRLREYIGVPSSNPILMSEDALNVKKGGISTWYSITGPSMASRVTEAVTVFRMPGGTATNSHWLVLEVKTEARHSTSAVLLSLSVYSKLTKSASPTITKHKHNYSSTEPIVVTHDIHAKSTQNFGFSKSQNTVHKKWELY